ncbi:hypothetical protein, unlikely [Trypanosoma congolense IL3000]|uniref:Uncharacterized protein n=1 Tax=Trypanosoma congolense (strain IL3000) TaxID=1068625 RepID=F9WFA6_TRYCI|nr:hypothetical protein, unlikely [Trypanosoma congolense IL3000]
MMCAVGLCGLFSFRHFPPEVVRRHLLRLDGGLARLQGEAAASHDALGIGSTLFRWMWWHPSKNVCQRRARWWQTPPCACGVLFYLTEVAEVWTAGLAPKALERNPSDSLRMCINSATVMCVTRIGCAHSAAQMYYKRTLRSVELVCGVR